jgi:glycine/D-amino acid oxidase-like deaminating enzyme
MGLSAAWALAGTGWRVRLLEQDPIPNPRGASHDQHRLIRHAYGAEPGYMAMVDAAYAVWERLWPELGAVLHVPTGVLAMAEAAGSPSLVPLVAENRMRVNVLLDRIPLLQRNIEHSNEQHEVIVAAITAGEPERAATAMLDHLAGSATLLHGFLD